MAKLKEVKITPKEIKEYKKINQEIYRNLISASKRLKNKVVVHVSATPTGGGVAELLTTQVALEKSLGIQSYWLTISNVPELFFTITKKMHNLLQGGAPSLTKQEKSFYLEIQRQLAESFAKYIKQFKSGTIIVHDPQPIGIVEQIPKGFRSILRVHPDLSTPRKATMDFLKPFIKKYDYLILSNKDYKESFSWLKKTKIKIIYPAIDPLSRKNLTIDPLTAHRILEQFNINFLKPILLQVSRFDKWKDPLGALKAYYIAKNKIPSLQLVLAGFFLAQDDPEAKAIFTTVEKHAKGDPDVFLFANPKKLQDVDNELFINALYTSSNVVIQKSIKEGFGLTVTEAMWKAKPVVAGKTSGTNLQIKNNKNGILIDTAEEAGEVIIKLFKNEDLRKKLGKSAHESVKEKFLIPRFLLDNIKLYK